jgi:hypothetical protein
MKAKRSSRKREHLLNDKSENRVFLVNEKRSSSPPVKLLLNSKLHIRLKSKST